MKYFTGDKWLPQDAKNHRHPSDTDIGLNSIKLLSYLSSCTHEVGWGRMLYRSFPDSKVHDDNTGPIWGRRDPAGPHKNIVRHTAHTIVSWPIPKQWLTIHTSDLMMIIR